MSCRLARPVSSAVRALIVVSVLGIGALPGAASSEALHVRPYTPLHALLEQTARSHGVPLEQVLADPARWLGTARVRGGSSSPAPVSRPPFTASSTADLPIRFAFPERVGEGFGTPYVGDVDGDHVDDLVAPRTGADSLVLFEGDALHPLESAHGVAVEPGDLLAAVADVDRDGRADVITLRGADGTAAVYRSSGGWTFLAPARLAAGPTPDRLFAADVSGDGWPDLVVTGGGTVRTLVNAGDGSFTPTAPIAVTSLAGPAVILDFDGDGRADLALRVEKSGAPGSPALALLRGLPGGDFAAWDEFATPGEELGSDLAAGDLDGDGVAEIVSGDEDSLRVHRGLGAGFFEAAVAYATFPYLDRVCLTVVDVDRDGRADVLLGVADPAGFFRVSSVLLYLGRAGGPLLRPLEWMAADPNAATFVGPRPVTADFNGDGATDLVSCTSVSGQEGGHVDLLLNDRLGGFLAPAIHHVPMHGWAWSLTSARLMPDRPEDVFVWDGSATWRATGVGPQGCDHVEFFRSGEVGSALDLNGDGLADLVMASGDSAIVYPSDGAGGFGAPVVYLGGTFLTCADFDGAHGPDLAVADAGGQVRVRLNDGGGHFGPATDWNVTLGTRVSSVSGADLDRDGRAELLVGTPSYWWAPDTLDIHWSAGSTFGPSQQITFAMPPSTGFMDGNPSTIAAGDFDGNGWPDLFIVLATYGDREGQFAIMLNMGGRQFLTPTYYDAGTDPWMGVVADFDRDGLDDVAVVWDYDQGNGGVTAFHAGFGGVLTPMDQGYYRGGVPCEHYPTSLALGDWDRDGRTDFVVGNVQGGTLGFYRNQSPLGLPTATSVSLTAASAASDGVHLEWYASAAGFSAAIERGDGSGAWIELARVAADGSGRLAWTDASAAPGSRAGYRLAWSEGGATYRSAETWLDVPLTGAPALALAGARPNPARGAAVLAFTLPRTGDATIEVFDVSGRVMARAELRAATAGAHALAVSRGRALPPGLYLARLVQGGERATARFVVAE